MRRSALLLLLPLLYACNQTQSPPPTLQACRPTQSPSIQGLPPSFQGLGDFDAPHVPGELLVLGGGFTPQGLLDRAGLLGEAEVLSTLPGGALHLRVPPGQERARAEALLRAGARYVQPNYLYRLLARPNDPLYPESLLDPSRQQPFFRLIQMEQAWDRFAPGCTPTVAVLDTAFDPKDPELAPNLLPGYNATPDGLSGPKALDPSPPPSGASYNADHGQGVAGLIAAVTNNGSYVAGVGWNRIKVLPIKVFYFVGSRYTSTTAVLDGAIRYAADQGANVINLSLGGPQDLYLRDSISYALRKGTVVVAAAGNDGTDGLVYPARYPGVIAAGSVRLDGRRSDFSNYSSTPADLVMAAGGNRVPPEALWSLALNRDYGYYRGLGRVVKWKGTSFSAPQVAGVAAMYIAQYQPRYGQAPTPDQVRTCLTMTASNGGRYDPQTGYGIVQADRVLTDTTYCFP